MKNIEWKKSIGFVGRTLLAYALVFTQGAWATQNQGTKDKAAPPQKAAAQQTTEKQSPVATSAKAQTEQAQAETSESAVAEEKPSGDGRHEGIKVHGHWTIEVRNPDGSLATHREFENSLQPQGASLLSSILGRQNTAGPWEVGLGVALASEVPPCLASTGIGVECDIFEPATGISAGNNTFTTLSVSTGAAGSLVLSGTAVAGQTGIINTVGSVEWLCAATVSPATCNFSISTSRFQFTQAIISPAISVSLGQTIAVTVNISFS